MTTYATKADTQQRQAIENTFLLLPGDWSEADILNPQEPNP